MTLHASPSPQSAPDWIRESKAFELGTRGGVLTVLGEPNAEYGPVRVPTLQQMAIGGYSEEEAAIVIAEEQRKANAGLAPYPKLAKSVVASPTSPLKPSKSASKVLDNGDVLNPDGTISLNTADDDDDEADPAPAKTIKAAKPRKAA